MLFLGSLASFSDAVHKTRSSRHPRPPRKIKIQLSVPDFCNSLTNRKNLITLTLGWVTGLSTFLAEQKIILQNCFRPLDR